MCDLLRRHVVPREHVLVANVPTFLADLLKLNTAGAVALAV